MLTLAKANELRQLILKVRQADDLKNRFCSGHTNYDQAQVNKIAADAKAGLDNFIDSNTEQEQ